MCKRFSLKFQDAERFLKSYDCDFKLDHDLETNPNDKALALYMSDNHLKVNLFNFGIVAKEHLLLNARIETLDTKPIFATSFETRRCILLASVFYEADKRKVDQGFVAKDDILFLAGIYQYNHFVLLTQKANEVVDFYHTRMPILLHRKSIEQYLMLPPTRDLKEKILSLEKAEIEAINSSTQILLF